MDQEFNGMLEKLKLGGWGFSGTTETAEKISDWAADYINEEELSLEVQKLTQSKDQRKVRLQIIRGSVSLTSPGGSRLRVFVGLK